MRSCRVVIKIVLSVNTHTTDTTDRSRPGVEDISSVSGTKCLFAVCFCFYPSLSVQNIDIYAILCTIENDLVRFIFFIILNSFCGKEKKRDFSQYSLLHFSGISKIIVLYDIIRLLRNGLRSFERQIRVRQNLGRPKP